MNNIEYHVKEALVDTLALSSIKEVNSDQSLKHDLKLDPMSSIMFLMKLEERIAGFTVDPGSIDDADLQTVSSVISYVNKQVHYRSMN